MKRIFQEALYKWNKQEHPLPLMLIGARQTGKTWILKAFSEGCFQNQVYLNFSENSEYADFFRPSLHPEDIVSRMELFFNRKIDIGKTIFFFDEIQDCEEAISSLKYFAESETPYKVITAGSLLGVKINRFQSSFPVGKVQINYLFPMDFEEFLWAMDEQMLADEMRKCYISNQSLPNIIHTKAITLYKTYLCIGGMPGIVARFIESGKDLVGFDASIAANILVGYMADMTKYSGGNNAVKINQVFHNIPEQLAKPNTKFMYKLLEDGANKEKFRTAIDWLLQANMLLLCRKVEFPQPPLSAYYSGSHFKLYMADTGLLVSLAKIKFSEIMHEGAMMFRGFIAENYVAQTFCSKGIDLCYWDSGNLAEVDFLLDIQDGIIPVEVKASENVRSKSLQSYIGKFHPKYAIRVSAKNFGFENSIKSVPLYALHCIQ
jgi:predicted AAA+ superfamily ATPase